MARLISRKKQEDAAKLARLQEVFFERQHEYDVARFGETLSQTYAANYAAGLEIDKTLLTLASAGLGVLLAFLSSKSVDSPYYLGIFYMALWCFCVTIVAALVALHENRKSTFSAIKGVVHPRGRQYIADWLALIGFSLGAIATAVLAAIIAWNTFSKGV